MLEQIIAFDKELFLFFNSLHSPFWDSVMFAISGKYLWIPLYLGIIFFYFKKNGKKAYWILLFTILAVSLADLISVHAFKNVFERLRPCHEPTLQGLVYVVNGKCGGQFGFVSSHAANMFAVAVFTLNIFRNKFFTAFILCWALVVSYSRIYLGVHYPVDVVCGALLGSAVAMALISAKKLWQTENELQAKT